MYSISERFAWFSKTLVIRLAYRAGLNWKVMRMNTLTRILFVALFAVFASPVMAAVSIVECQDGQGERSFHSKNCPPGTTKIGSKKIRTGRNGGGADNSNISATIYLSPVCEPCEEVREFLNNRNISFSEKNVEGDLEMQQELKGVSGGALNVPVTVIGDTAVTGYNRGKLNEALSAAGYVSPDSAESVPGKDALEAAPAAEK